MFRTNCYRNNALFSELTSFLIITHVFHVLDYVIEPCTMPNAQCAVVGCTSSFAQLQKWKRGKCLTHNSRRSSCPCKQPYTLIRFPKDDQQRASWEKRIN